ncbi:MAG: hypothetical protein AAF919_02320 [Pseudomonadota bacterium]
MTPLGYVFVASILLGVVLTWGVARRRSRMKGSFGPAGTLLLGFMLTNVSTLFVMLAFFLADIVRDMIILPKYTAEIVDVESAWEEVRRTDSDGDSWTEDVLMHTPILRFEDETGRFVTLPGNVRSGAAPIIGDMVRVAYGGGSVKVISVASIGLLAGGGLIVAILGYILLHAVYYSVGRSQARLGEMGVKALFYGLFPLGMLGMFAGLLWGGVIEFLRVDSDVPVWAFVVSLFFCVVLVLAAVGLVMSARQEKPRRRGRRGRRAS